MGFFSNLLRTFTQKPKTVEEILAEDHPAEWYETKTSSIFVKVFTHYTDEGADAAVNLYCLKYFGALENVKALKERGMRVDEVILGKEYASLIAKVIAEQTDPAMKSFLVGQSFKVQNVPFLQFAKKLNHNFYGEVAFYVTHLIFLRRVDVEKDEWLYDEELFRMNPEDDDENGSKLFAKVSPFLAEKGLLTQEIMSEIQANL